MSEVESKLLDYFNGDELAANVWKSKYAAEGEETPDDMHRRLAKEFARIEVNYIEEEGHLLPDNLSEYAYERHMLDEESIYNLFKDFKYIVPQGSIMSTLGTNIIASLSNCWVVESPLDSYSSILRADGHLAYYYKRRGGVGADISNLRPKNTATNNTSKSSTGAVSFMHRFSNTTREVAMNGRRGALMLSIDINHPDVMDFIKIKRDGVSVTGANISIKLNNEFMKAVENDEDYILRFPCNTDNWAIETDGTYEIPYDELIHTSIGETKYIKKVKAKEYWDEIIKSARNYAEPGLMYWDNVIDNDPAAVYPQYKPVTSNPCFVGETKLLTATGYRKISDCTGELELVNKDGKIVNGLVWSNGIKPIVELTLSNKVKIKCTEDHVFMTNNGISVQALDLRGERLMSFFEINQEVSEFTKYGFIQGDGGLNRLNSTSHKGLEVHIGQDDDDILELFGLDKEVGKRTYYINGYNEIFRSLKFDASTLETRSLPKTFINWEINDKKMFLKGMYSANGSVIKVGRISYKTISKNLAVQLSDVLSSLGISSYITTNKEKEVEFSNGTYTCKESYDVNIGSFDSILKFAKEIGFVHQYKQESLKQIILDKSPKVINVKEAGEEEVFDFSLDDDTHWGVVEGIIAHNCGEQFLNANDSCRLMVLNLFSFVKEPFTEDAYIDYEELYKISYEHCRLGDDLIDLELEYIQRIIDKIKSDPEPDNIKRDELELWETSYKNTKAGRRIGLGITALADMLAALNLKYDSDEALEVIDLVMNVKMRAELDCSIDLAILRGTFDGWEVEDEFDWKINLIRDNHAVRSVKGKNQFYQMLVDNFYDQVERMSRYGRRNISWSTIAPTGTTSLMTQTTSGCEPLFLPFYMRRKKINPNEVGVRVDFVDEVGDSWQEFPVLHPKFKDWCLFKIKTSPVGKIGTDEEILNYYISDSKKVEVMFEDSPWYKSTANDIDWQKRNEIQAILQKYTTNAISSTINLPSSVTEKEVSDIYFNGWKLGLKGQTVYVDGSRSGVLVSDTKPNKEIFEHKDAPKRPKELDAEAHIVSVKGVKYSVFVGIYDGKPYEVFAYPGIAVKGDGKLIKQSKGSYDFIQIGSSNSFNVCITDKMTEEEATITRLISVSLRHGANIKFVVEQLNKGNGDITSFIKAIARVLKKYIPDGETAKLKCEECGSTEVIFEEGCSKCKSCGSSKCG